MAKLSLVRHRRASPGTQACDPFPVSGEQRSGTQRVLTVSSGGPIAVCQQQVAAPAPVAIALNLQIRNSSITQYFFNTGVFHLASFNDIPRLDDPQRQAFRPAVD